MYVQQEWAEATSMENNYTKYYTTSINIYIRVYHLRRKW